MFKAGHETSSFSRHLPDILIRSLPDFNLFCSNCGSVHKRSQDHFWP